MEDPNSSTKGESKISSSESNIKENNETQETLDRVLASKQSLKKKKKSEYLTILVFYYRKDKKINSNQLENDQSR
uniref:Uncharacterized protein n=1 Tax=Saimiri boliviensis boliviensis TaxID=39432 RepID=A0A2K6TAI3_SAIBB